MTQEDILERMRTVVAAVAMLSPSDAKRITADFSLEDDLSLSSLDLIDLALITDITFNIHTDLTSLRNVKTVGDWLNIITPLINTR